MKKLGTLLIMFVAILFISGCGNKENLPETTLESENLEYESITYKMIEKSKQKAAEDAAYGVIKSSEFYYTEQMIENGEFNGAVFICDDKNSGSYKCQSSDNSILLEFNGTQPTSGEIKINSNGEVTFIKNLVINKYICSLDSKGKIECNK